jgi:hypothetical protein
MNSRFIAAMMLVAVALVSGCSRGPDEAPTAAERDLATEQEKFNDLAEEGDALAAEYSKWQLSEDKPDDELNALVENMTELRDRKTVQMKRLKAAEFLVERERRISDRPAKAAADGEAMRDD